MPLHFLTKCAWARPLPRRACRETLDRPRRPCATSGGAYAVAGGHAAMCCMASCQGRVHGRSLPFFKSWPPDCARRVGLPGAGPLARGPDTPEDGPAKAVRLDRPAWAGQSASKHWLLGSSLRGPAWAHFSAAFAACPCCWTWGGTPSPPFFSLRFSVISITPLRNLKVKNQRCCYTWQKNSCHFREC